LGRKENLKLLSSFLIVSGFILLLMNVFAPSLLLGIMPPYEHYMDIATSVPYQDPPWGIAGTVLSKCVFPISGTNPHVYYDAVGYGVVQRD